MGQPGAWNHGVCACCFRRIAPAKGFSRDLWREVPDELLGDGLLANHRVGDRVTVAAEEADVERFVIIPMMTFQAAPTPAPDAAWRASDQAELLGQGRRVARRAS